MADADPLDSPQESKPNKIHDGYHGWMKTIPKTKQDCAPQRIDQSQHVDATQTSAGNSIWNSAGTWEERDKSQWALDRLRHHVTTSFSISDDALGLVIKTKSIVRCDGEAKIVFSRGKKRCGYDIFLKFEWQSTRQQEDPEGIPEVTGHVEVYDFDDTSGEDYEVRVTTSNDTSTSQHAQTAKQCILQNESLLRNLLQRWKDELMEQ